VEVAQEVSAVLTVVRLPEVLLQLLVRHGARWWWQHFTNYWLPTAATRTAVQRMTTTSIDVWLVVAGTSFAAIVAIHFERFVQM
jgi:hypothetical protein